MNEEMRDRLRHVIALQHFLVNLRQFLYEEMGNISSNGLHLHAQLPANETISVIDLKYASTLSNYLLSTPFFERVETSSQDSSDREWALPAIVHLSTPSPLSSEVLL